MNAVGNYVKMVAAPARRFLSVRLDPFFDARGRDVSEHVSVPGFDAVFDTGAILPGGKLPETLGDVLDGDSLLAGLGSNAGLQHLLVEMVYRAGCLAGGVISEFSNKEAAFTDLIDWLPRGPRERLLPFKIEEFVVVAGPGPVGELFDAVDALWAKAEEGSLEEVDGFPEPERGLFCLEETIVELHELAVAAREVGADFVAFHY